jgi:LPXTG-site transpeptidase (sortase) family protein
MTRRLRAWVVTAVALCALGLAGFAMRTAAASDNQWQEATPAAATVQPPTRVRIASIGVDTSLEDLKLDEHGSLTPPHDFAKAGWYADGTVPGEAGPAVIAGHVDSHNGPAVFFRLNELKVGSTIEVTRADRVVTFKVLAVKRYPKAEFPTNEVYAPTPNAQLRLITCGGAFDSSRRSYVDNVVVYAVAV